MLQKRVSEIALINIDRIPTDRAGFGSTLHVIESNGEKLIFQLVMPEDADAAKGLISTTSPIGRAFLNKEPGDYGQGRDARRHARVRNHQAVHHPRRSRRNDRCAALTAVAPNPTHHNAAPPSCSPAPARPAPITPACCARCTKPASRSTSSAGRGIGVVGALFAAVDGAQRLWDEQRILAVAARSRALYPWRPVAAR